jgi:hypothetical protein
MKNNFFSSLSGMAVLASICINANGQLTNKTVPPAGDFTFSKKNNTKESPVSVWRRVNSAVVRNFIKSYPNAANVSWFEVKNGFTALFNLDSIHYQVTYDKNGAFARTIRSYDQTRLLPDIRHLVKSNYYDYEINLVNEIETPQHPITYIIQLIGKTKLMNLEICEGELKILQEFKK